MTEQGKAISHAIETYSTGLSSFAKTGTLLPPLVLRWGIGLHREGSKQSLKVKILHNL